MYIHNICTEPALSVSAAAASVAANAHLHDERAASRAVAGLTTYFP